VRIGLHFEAEVAVFRFMAEWAFHRIQHAGEVDFFSLDGNRPGLDLRQIKNIGD